MSDNIIPFRRRDEKPRVEGKEAPEATPAADPNEEWTLVQIVAKAPPTSR